MLKNDMMGVDQERSGSVRNHRRRSLVRTERQEEDATVSMSSIVTLQLIFTRYNGSHQSVICEEVSSKVGVYVTDVP